ncbi:MAG: LysM peptidoglycan-binding domain-containing protein [Bdellovibrionales bacterium]|nr:LysM peptidoglycan-binding domain-containing protein [Bdellovibrionales bacterium]
MGEGKRCGTGRGRGVERALAAGCAVVLVGSLAACATTPPPPPPRQQTIPVEPAPYAHTVRYRGETLGLIARWYTGVAGNWQQLLEANPGLRPERINIGDTIFIPAALVTNDAPLPESAVRAVSKKAAESAVEAPVENPAEQAAPSDEVAPEVAVDDLPVETAPESTPSVDDLLGELAGEQQQNSAPEPVPTLGDLEQPSPEAAPVQEDKGIEDAEREKLLDELLAQ